MMYMKTDEIDGVISTIILAQRTRSMYKFQSPKMDLLS